MVFEGEEWKAHGITSTIDLLFEAGGFKWVAILRAQALDHAMYPGDVVVGAADELEEALCRILAHDAGTFKAPM